MAKLSPEQGTLSELSGERIRTVLTRAPSNDAPFSGLKVIVENGWFADLPSETENINKIYLALAGSGSFAVHHRESQAIVSDDLAAGKQQARSPAKAKVKGRL